MLIGWMMEVHLNSEDKFDVDCSQEWENVIAEAHEIFDTSYEGAAMPEKIIVYNVYADSDLKVKTQWLSKEDIV